MSPLVCYEHKDEVVNEYETQLTQHLEAGGLTSEVLFPMNRSINPTLYRWRELIDGGFPFLKVATASSAPRGVDISRWREVLRSHGYDTRNADLTLALLAHHQQFSSTDLLSRKLNPQEGSSGCAV